MSSVKDACRTTTGPAVAGFGIQSGHRLEQTANLVNTHTAPLALNTSCQSQYLPYNVIGNSRYFIRGDTSMLMHITSKDGDTTDGVDRATAESIATRVAKSERTRALSA